MRASTVNLGMAVFLSFFSFFLQPIFAADGPYDFRKTSWGMSMAEVKASETATLLENLSNTPDLIGYRGQFEGLSCAILYRFEKDKLFKGTYIVAGIHDDPDDYFADYEKLRENLTGIYGKAVREKVEWRDPEYKDDPKKWGLAVSMGHMTQRHIWETSSTLIMLSLGGNKQSVSICLTYEGKNFKPLVPRY